MQNNFQKFPDSSRAFTKIYEIVHHYNNSTNHPKLIFFTPSEDKNTILQLKKKSASGPYSISNSVLKYSINTILHLYHIFNGCARLKYFPDCWKQAAMFILPKPSKNPPFLINHRPIYLINTLYKVFEHFLLTCLNIYTINKIRVEQFRLRRQHSTSLRIVNSLDDIISNLNRCLNIVVVLLDV